MIKIHVSRSWGCHGFIKSASRRVIGSNLHGSRSRRHRYHCSVVSNYYVIYDICLRHPHAVEFRYAPCTLLMPGLETGGEFPSILCEQLEKATGSVHGYVYMNSFTERLAIQCSSAAKDVSRQSTGTVASNGHAEQRIISICSADCTHQEWLH